MIMAAIGIALAIAAACLLLATVAIVAQALAVSLLREQREHGGGPRPACLLLVPAHDEALGIARTVRELLAEAAPGDRVVVVADNCSDDTAEVARAAGAEVIERVDPELRGKGHALGTALRLLRADGRPLPPVIVFVDADCSFDRGSLDRLVRACAVSGTPVQCRNLMVYGPQQPRRSRLAEFAWRIRNDFRPEGYARLGLPCQLFGTGMAMPSAFATAERFDTGHVTEDLLIGVEAALAGFPPRYVREATLFSRFPDTEAGVAQQKKRWVHGHLSVIASHAPRLLLAGASRRSLALVAMGLDILTPPLALLAIGHLSVLAGSLVLLLLGGLWSPFALAAVGCAAFVLALIAAWRSCGRDLIGWRELRQTPQHVWQVMRTAIGFMKGERSGWVRTDRTRLR